MIAIDSSALLAIILDEPERKSFLDSLDRAEKTLVSAATLIESRMVAHGKGGEKLVLALDEIVQGYAMEIVPPSPAEIAIAHAAFVKYGKGNGHPAQLNFGDLFSYALAKSRGVPLLFKGDDFALTDVEVAG